MTGFTAPPSTTDSTTHLFKCVPGQDFYHSQMEYTRACVVIRFQIKRDQVQNVCNVLNLKIPNTSTIEDVTYTANMAYADFYPELLNEHQCIKYAAAVANDKDGYTGIQFCRWVADVVGKKENIDWDKFK